MRRPLLVGLALALLVLFLARGTEGPTPFAQLLSQPNPIQPLDTVFLEEMTWIEVRDALTQGKRTAIIPVGGVEQNGPYVALGKHNYILKLLLERVARSLGDTIVAPVIPLSPEGALTPPSGHMIFPGTISIRPETLMAIVQDTADSLASHGFTYIILVADSFDAQEPLRALAKREAPRYRTGGKLIHFLPEYYNYDKLRALVENRGISMVQQPGVHDDIVFSSLLALIDPSLIRLDQRIASGLTSVGATSLIPLETTLLLARDLVEFRTSETVKAIQTARENAR